MLVSKKGVSVSKYSISDAADILGISKEAVYNRIRRNSLEVVVENDEKFVLLDEQPQNKSNKKPSTKQNTKPNRTKPHPSDEKYILLLLERIEELKKQVLKLENDKEKLIREKEEILIESRQEVERIYTQKDKQLKQIVTLVSRPLLTYMQNINNDAIDADFEELTPYERGLVFKSNSDKWINADEYMQQKGYAEKKRKQTLKQLSSKLGKDKNLKDENGVLFIKRGAKIKQILRSKS